MSPTEALFTPRATQGILGCGLGGAKEAFEALGAAHQAGMRRVATREAADILRQDMIAAGRTAKQYAAHVVPTNDLDLTRRSDLVKQAVRGCQSKFSEFLGSAMRNRDVNGFFTDNARHLGSHSDAFYTEMWKMMKSVRTELEMVQVLDRLKELLKKGKF